MSKTAVAEEKSNYIIRFHAAFEDGDGIFVDDKPFADAREALGYVNSKNQDEVNRFSAGHVPDTAWFVMRVATRLTPYKKVPLPEQTAPRAIKSNEEKVRRKKITAKRKIVRRKA